MTDDDPSLPVSGKIYRYTYEYPTSMASEPQHSSGFKSYKGDLKKGDCFLVLRILTKQSPIASIYEILVSVIGKPEQEGWITFIPDIEKQFDGCYSHWEEYHHVY